MMHADKDANENDKALKVSMYNIQCAINAQHTMCNQCTTFNAFSVPTKYAGLSVITDTRETRDVWIIRIIIIIRFIGIATIMGY